VSIVRGIDKSTIIVYTKQVFIRGGLIMKNITFSADPTLIHKAREQARKAGMTLNDAFRQWLRGFAGQGPGDANYRDLMKRLTYARSGRRFSRQELNER
jgi:hypothetical protein